MAHQSVKRLTSSVFALLLVVGAGVVFFAFVKPLYGNILSVRGEELSRRMFLEEQQRVVDVVKKIVIEYAGQGQVQDTLSSALPLAPSVADALLQIQGIANARGVAIRSYEVSIPPPTPLPRQARGAAAETAFVQAVSPVNVRVELAGTYEAFKGFLDNLETNIRLFDVKNVAIQPTARAAPTALAFTVNLSAYYQHR